MKAKKLFTSALAAVMTLSSIAAMSANAYARYPNITDNEHYKAHIESLNNSEYCTPLTPELVEYMDGILSDNYAPNVKNAWTRNNKKEICDNGRIYCRYNIEYSKEDYITFELDLSDEETENALEVLKDELGCNDKLTFTKEDSSGYHSPYISIGFLDDNHKLNVMTAEKAYSILKEKYPTTICSSAFDIRNFDTVLMQNCVTSVDGKHHMDMTEQEKKDFYDSIDHDYIKENFRATYNPETYVIEFPDDYTQEEKLGCFSYFVEKYNARIHQYCQTAAMQPISADFSSDEISYLNGDANCDKSATMADAAAILQAIGNPDKYALSDLGEFNADYAGDGLTADDAIAIQKKLAGITE